MPYEEPKVICPVCDHEAYLLSDSYNYWCPRCRMFIDPLEGEEVEVSHS